MDMRHRAYIWLVLCGLLLSLGFAPDRTALAPGARCARRPNVPPDRRPREPDREEGLVPDVMGQFRNLQLHGDAMAFHLGVGDNPSLCRHYQGMARIDGPDGTPYVLLTRSGSEAACVGTGDYPGELLVVRLGSRDRDGERLRSNLLRRGVPMPSTLPPPEDRGVVHIPFNGQDGWPKFSHLGGVQLVDGVLVVPLEDYCAGNYGGGTDACSTTPRDVGGLTLVDVSDPENPSQLLTKTFPTLEKIGVVGVTYVRQGEHPTRGGRYLFALTWGKSTDIRFAWSNSSVLTQTTDIVLEPFTWHGDHLDTHKDRWRNWQMLNFVRDVDGSLYLVGAEKDLTDNWKDMLGLFRVDVLKITRRDCGQALTYVGEKHLQLNTPDMGSLDAASGIYVSPSGQLILYTGPHDNDGPGGTVEMGEFRSIDTHHPGTTTAAAICPWVELYEDESGWDDDSPDRSLVLDFVDRGLEDWDDLDREDFGDQADSLRWYLAPGQKLHLFEDAHHSYEDSFLELVGDGSVHWITELDSQGFGDQIDSVKVFPFADPGGPYDVANGIPTTLNAANPCYGDGEAAFSWRTNSRACTFVDPTARQPILVCLAAGRYEVELTVQEGDEQASASTVVTVDKR